MTGKSDRIAIIGGGLSGLVIAEALERRGYAQVTLFEKDLRLGGKLDSIDYRGRSYEMGAIFGLPSYQSMRGLMDRLSIRADGPRLARINYNSRGEKVMPLPMDDLDRFVEELERLPRVLQGYEEFLSGLLEEVDPILMEPFDRWCDAHNFKVLKTVYIHYFTIFGLGAVDEVPAIYVLRIMGYDHLMSFMDIPRFQTWKGGVQTLADALGKRIRDLRLGQPIEEIKLGKGGGLLLKTPYEEFVFDKLIITSPLENFIGLDFWDEDFKELLSRIRYQHFNVYAFLIKGGLRGCGSILDNLSPDKRGHLILWDTRWPNTKEEEERLVILYAYDPPRGEKSPLDYIKEDLEKLGVKEAKLYQMRRWKHCPYFDKQGLEAGFYKKISQMQGENNIYFSGELINTLSLENAIKNSEHFVEKYF